MLLIERGKDEYSDYLKDLIPLSDHWKEFYFRTGECLTDYVRTLQKLSRLCHSLYLPNLIRMTLIYPDPGCYDTDGEGLEDYWSYRPGCELFPITKGKPIDPFHVNYIGMDPEKISYLAKYCKKKKELKN